MKSRLLTKESSLNTKESTEARLTRMLAFDEALRQELASNTVLIGCDEVGRGSLIGNVVASAVSWKSSDSPKHAEVLQSLIGINDSKKLTAKQREALLPEILDLCHVGIGQASPEEIAEHNIIGASMLAVQRAIDALFGHLKEEEMLHCHYLMDGRDRIPTIDSHQQSPIVKGDAQSALIAMASIVAKEHRDGWVRSVAEDFSDYGWASNMGYATAKHREALRRLGATPHHRPSYNV
ncbi:MAG: ribonuclease HII [Vampirovibrionales bacterium]